jgi:hypothetical protein
MFDPAVLNFDDITFGEKHTNLFITHDIFFYIQINLIQKFLDILHESFVSICRSYFSVSI